MVFTMDSIVLLAKQPGLTSFSSLRNVKKALQTTKVGHTGTLDSFAQGLLVVCTGRLTKLAGNITEFDKSYKAVIKFGSETDTLEYTGNIIKETELPDEQQLIDAINHFKGELLQQPPAFSAIHVAGKRASDLARNGKTVEIPSRKINVYESKLIEVKKNSEGKVEYCLIDFTVSKGTYIRSLARDIGQFCNSSAHLVGLYRTRVGNFKIEDAAGFSLLEDFNIESCLRNLTVEKSEEKFNSEQDRLIQDEILKNEKKLTKDTASLCGFVNINLIDEDSAKQFCNGKPLKNKLFIENLYEIPTSSICSVFYNDNFYGLLEKDESGKIRYKFVNN